MGPPAVPVHLAKRVEELKPSASIAAKNKVVELQAAGHRIVDFTVGEPDFDTPSHIVAAAAAAMSRGETRYTATSGTLALRKAIIAKLARENSLIYSPERIVVGGGAKQIIWTAFEATLNEGDEVVIPAPYWVSYPEMVKLSGGVPVIVVCPKTTRFKLTPEALEAAISPRTRWLVLNSPNNPTGAVYTATEMAALAEVLLRHDHVMVMTDDIYEHITYDQAAFANLAQIEPLLMDRVLVVNGVSKTYAMTGWRIGYGAGPVALIQAIVKLLGQSTTCASALSQAAAIAAMEGDQAFVSAARQEYSIRRDRFAELLNGIPGFQVDKPDGAFYLYPSVQGLIGMSTPRGELLRTDLDVALYLLEEAKVAVLDGTAYGLSPHLRLSFAVSIPVIEAGCRQISEAVAKLRAA